MRHTNKITLILTSILMIFTIVCSAWSSDVFVHGYYRSDGTYVNSHYRSAPNDTPWDNWSTYGNINPYTGEIGTKIPYIKNYSDTYTPSYQYSPSYNDAEIDNVLNQATNYLINEINRNIAREDGQSINYRNAFPYDSPFPAEVIPSTEPPLGCFTNRKDGKVEYRKSGCYTATEIENFRK